jgi:hypothetical protein
MENFVIRNKKQPDLRIHYNLKKKSYVLLTEDVGEVVFSYKNAKEFIEEGSLCPNDWDIIKISDSVSVKNVRSIECAEKLVSQDRFAKY